MHVTQLLLDTFHPIDPCSVYQTPDYSVEFSLGDLAVNGIVSKQSVVFVRFLSNDDRVFERYFKGHDRLIKVSDWLLRLTDGRWSSVQHNWLVSAVTNSTHA